MIGMWLELQNLAFVGHLGDPVALAAVGLANMMYNIFAYSTMFGMNSALETLAS